MGTAGQWARDFLAALGNASPSDKTVNMVAAWTMAEGTEARYNPLATTLDYGANTKFNNCCGGNGVKNYTSRQQGIEASVITLRGNHTGYEKLRNALLKNEPEKAIASGGLDTWGSGSARVATLFATDQRAKMLKSEGGRGHNPDNTQTDTTIPNPNGISHNRVAEPDYVPNRYATKGVTGDIVKNALKIMLGIGIALVASLMIIYSASQTDAAKIAVKVASKGVL